MAVVPSNMCSTPQVMRACIRLLQSADDVYVWPGEHEDKKMSNAMVLAASLETQKRTVLTGPTRVTVTQREIHRT